MELRKDEIIQNYGKRYGYCNRNTLLPYEYKFTCFSCGYNVNKRKLEISKIQRKKINFYKPIRIFRTESFFHMCRCI